MWWLVAVAVAWFFWCGYQEKTRNEELDRQAEKTIRETSIKYRELTNLLNEAHYLPVNIARVYPVTERSKKRVENFDAIKYMVDLIGKNFEKYDNAARQIAANNAHYARVKAQVEKIVGLESQYQDDELYREKEITFCRMLKYQLLHSYDDKFLLRVNVSYISPKGRNHYESNISFDFSALCEMLKVVRPDWSLEEEPVVKLLPLPVTSPGQNPQLLPSSEEAAGKTTEITHIEQEDEIMGDVPSINFTQSVPDIREKEAGEGDKFMNYGEIEFGNYAGKPITWLIVQTAGDSKVLVSKNILDVKSFHSVFEDVDWTTCSLRKWLQGTFFNAAFSDVEKKQIMLLTNSVAEGDKQSLQERISLLSVEQLRKYFRNNEARKCEVTDFALRQGAFVYPKGSRFGYWWTCTEASATASMTCITPSGAIMSKDRPVNDKLGIRPMIILRNTDNSIADVRVSGGNKKGKTSKKMCPDKAKLKFTDYELPLEMMTLEKISKNFGKELKHRGEVSEGIFKQFCQAMVNVFKAKVSFWIIRQYTEKSWKQFYEDCIVNGNDFDSASYEGNTIYAYYDNEDYEILVFTNPGLAMAYAEGEDIKRCMPTKIDLYGSLEKLDYSGEKFLGIVFNIGTDDILLNELFRDKLIRMMEEKKVGGIQMEKRDVGMICDKCEKIYDAKFKFCPECGTPLHPELDYSKCAKCGFEVQEGMKFCPNCGNKLLHRPDPEPALVHGYRTMDFGHYKGEIIKWMVVEETKDSLTLVAEKSLDVVPFNEEREEVDWEHCSLRRWLNDDFINEAFTEGEREDLKDVLYTNGGYGDETLDRVCLLSIDEAKKYFTTEKERICLPTDYAKEQGAGIFRRTGGCNWWLRTPGNNLELATIVTTSGYLNSKNSFVETNFIGIRPMIIIGK